MDSLFERLLVILFVFAVLDLMVGVANDAVNFLNSAIGTKVSSRNVILIVASIGILVGALTSSGMMEVARKGIFNPEMFSFSNIMIVFLAVVITDVLLLDFYNTLRLPTSTTVSIVFEVLGAATAIAILHVLSLGEPLSAAIAYINVKNASDIASSILLSVGISFTVGMIVQSIARMIFTHQYESRLPKFGAIFGGIAITCISYFLLIKGIKDSSLLSPEQYSWIQSHTTLIIGMLVAIWTAILQIGQLWFKRNIPKIIVLFGTFSLAAAFAGNDLVNFIGVPIAGYNSYQLFMQSGGGDATTFMMDGLAGKVPTQFFLLFLAGAIMTATIRFSRKAVSVTETEISLTRQQAGNERFSPGFFSRALVRHAVKVHKLYERIMPTSWVETIKQRFAQGTEQFQDHKYRQGPAFDLIRGSVNLTVASILIAIATSMKLPLSTTYVTFMVAMGTALADGVRGRETAVYRVTGVLTVIGGWFMTAISAFVMTGLVAAAIRYGGEVIIGVLLAFAGFILYKTHLYHAKSVEKTQNEATLLEKIHDDLGNHLQAQVTHLLPKVAVIYENLLTHIIHSNDSLLKKVASEAEQLAKTSKVIKSNIHQIFINAPDEAIFHGEKYVQAIDYLRKCTTSLENITGQARDYALNQHPDFIEIQQEELLKIKQAFSLLFQDIVQAYTAGSLQDLDLFDARIDLLIHEIEDLRTNQLGRIKGNALGVRNTMLYLNLMMESKNLCLYCAKLLHLGRKLLGEVKHS